MNSWNDPGETTVDDKNRRIKVVCGRTLIGRQSKGVCREVSLLQGGGYPGLGLGEHLDWMKIDDQENPTGYKVLVNHEEQYSIWPADRKNPLGWRDAGKSGDKAECLAYIKQVWTDMRPLSLRKRMDGKPTREG